MLTQEQIDFFHANGYLIMRGVMRGRELEMLQGAADDVIQQGISGIGAEDHRYAAGPDGHQVYWRSERMWDRAAIWQAVTVNPVLLENIGQCIGQPFFPWNDSLVVKLPRSGAPVKWHQDPPYSEPQRSATYPVPNFTTDIYLDHSGPDNGCVYAIPARHLLGHVDLSQADPELLFRQCGAIPIEMEAGDVLFHCLSTPHGSRPNLSETQRRIFYIHYLADEVYQDGYGDAPWAAEKPGWGEFRREACDSMIRKRGEIGLDSPECVPTLAFGDGGFAFCGSPSTPLRHWHDLAARIPVEERERLKRLDCP